MTSGENAPEEATQDIIETRRQKLAELRERGVAFPNDFRPDSQAGSLHGELDGLDKDELGELARRVAVAGRIVLKRHMGKASFLTIQDVTGRLQLYVRQDGIGEEDYADFVHWDIGDIVGGTGTMFKTNRGELSVEIDGIRLLTKSLRPLPEKYHGLSDTETRYRQRYLDLIMSEDSREVFRQRSKIVDFIRRYLTERDYMEVETPMMQVIPGGATAEPFVTHYRALDTTMYLRVAPELNLKRLVVGGFERVFEINRNFRNEGMSTKHSPEFTMLEFYQAYATFEDMMDLTEDMLRSLCSEVLGSLRFTYAGTEIDLEKPFERLTMNESILRYNPDIAPEDLDDPERLLALARRHGISPENGWGDGKLLMELFEALVEDRIEQPTYIVQHPTEVSPLARRNDREPNFSDRFELFIMGKEVANGFSELNDPEDQAERFMAQVRAKDAGDNEAMHYDEDYIVALEYGLPPTAGEGLGIDRLVMLLTDCASIRDVVLFPHMRPRD